MDGPCQPWPIDPTCNKDIPVDPAERTPAQAAAVEIATEALWRLSAGQYGLCEVTVRPCRQRCAQVSVYWTGSQWLPTIINGEWVNLPNCGCGPLCSCAPSQQVQLPGPIHSVTEVRIDNVVLPATAYRVDNYSMLVRIDGGGWPYCQNMDLPETEPDTWAVTYQRGREVPLGGQRAVAALAAEYIKACTGQRCKLPGKITEITREGITMSVLDDMSYLENGKTGIGEVDFWLSTVNPRGNIYTSSVYNPDEWLSPTHLQTTWRAP